MSQIWKDGEVIISNDSTVHTELDDYVYEGENPNVIVAYTQEDFDELVQTYQQAQAIEDLDIYPQFQELMKFLKSGAKVAINAELFYSGEDEDKAKKLRLNRIKALNVVETIEGIIRDCKLVPKPVLQLEEQPSEL